MTGTQALIQCRKCNHIRGLHKRVAHKGEQSEHHKACLLCSCEHYHAPRQHRATV